ncbi:lipase 3-like [Melitaea cinxia]|uniref:lipase 3-like n=1 Tax=Melitaea cinxia TaxID=113334 RepID=UPI001E26FAC1|nr:lipase 3-like [Melitaea cinxia]
MLKTLTSVIILIFALNGLTAQQEFNIRLRTAIDGYYSESHNVITRDGYILEVHRIPFRRFRIKENDSKNPKPVVFLMHGLQGSSLSYIYLGPERALAYLLAEAGYDVWMGNARGGLNSRRHIFLNPDTNAERFFNYSYEDIALKDVASTIDYILKVTRQSQLHYVGHSQGGTAFFVLNSLRPEFNTKIKSAHLLAGVGYMEHFPNKILNAIAFGTNLLYSVALEQGIVEVLGPRDANSLNEEEYNKSPAYSLLLTVIDVIVSIHKQLEMVTPASLKQYAHFGQNIRAKSFRRFSYDPLENFIRYGSLSAPEYDLSKISVNITMHYTVNDHLLDERDVLSMASVIPNAKARKITRETYNHNDFVLAPDSKELLYDYILEELDKNR